MQSKLNQLLVFPTSRKVREFVTNQKGVNTLLPTILTIDEFFKKSTYFENKKYIEEDERFLYLNEACKNINLSKLGISKTFTQFLKQSNYIYRFFSELSSEKIDIDDISSNDTYEFYTEHLQILKEILVNYLDILEKNNSIDRVNFAKYYLINKDFLSQYESIKIYFEGYFTNIEFDIINEISKLLPINIEFVYNQYNKKSIEKFLLLGFELEENYKYEIDLQNKTILKKQNIKKEKNFELKAFSSRINQIAYIKKSIEVLVTNGVDPNNIVVILPDEKFSSMLALFDNENYFNFAMGKDIYNSKLFKTSQAIYEYINDDEIKNIENIKFLNLDIKNIDILFKSKWNSLINKESFNEIIEYLRTIETNRELLDKFDETIYKLERIIFLSKKTVLVKDFFKILLQKISQISFDDINSGKITVMGLLESRILDFEAVIICDFNESLIPKVSVKDKFLSSKVKSKVKLPTPHDRENLQKYYYERLTMNTNYLFVSYVKNETEQLSRFATKLFDIEIDENTYDNQYKHILYTSKTINHFNEEVILDIDLSELTWSASSLKEFLECKRKYYLNHILKIKEHEISLLPKGYELGNIIHKTLEDYYSQDKRAYEILIDIFNKNRINSVFLNFELEIWKRKLEDFFNKEKKREIEKGFKVLQLEKKFEIDFNGIKLKGTIDRIDKVEDSIWVIDYKTSKNLTVSTKKTFESSNDFQLEFYYLAVNELYNTNNIKTYYYDLYNNKLIEETVIDEKLLRLEAIFKEFKTSNVSFDKCEKLQICQYCTYKEICNR